MKPWIIVEVKIKAPIEKIWSYWTEPEHITHWCFAGNDWCAPRAVNDLRIGGKFNTRMESRDGKEGFDMAGVYTNVEQHKKIEYEFDGRAVKIEFIPEGEGYKIVESFAPEDVNSEELQRSGWQSILDNFKKYVENN